MPAPAGRAGTAQPFPPHAILVAISGLSLLAGLTGALVLLGVPMPAHADGLGARHGVLMALGFLGTLIALERAVALDRAWGFISPLASGLGAIGLVIGLPQPVSLGLIAVGAAGFVAMYIAFDRIERSLHTSVQAVGAIAWLVASILLLAGWSPARVIAWLAAFLVMTIVGERLELSRLGSIGGPARIGLVAAAAVFCGGVALTLALPDWGTRLAGVGLVAMAAWLSRYDLARRTVRMSGLTRFVALALLAGFAWLAVTGLAWIGFGATSSGPAYDASLHAVFLGFVISMVFGHAPIILPAVMRRPLPYHPRFYAHLALLHLGLLVRIVGGDLAGLEAPFVIGGVINVIALLVFAASSATAVAFGRRSAAAAGRQPALADRP